MTIIQSRRFCINSVLIDKFFIGLSPPSESYLDLRQQLKACFRLMFGFCSPRETSSRKQLSEQLSSVVAVLPKSQDCQSAELYELRKALEELEWLHQTLGALFVRCVAAIGLSPLHLLDLALAGHASLPNALIYIEHLMKVHPGTNPLTAKLALVEVAS